jgi:hypothetical protein
MRGRREDEPMIRKGKEKEADARKLGGNRGSC